MSILTATKPKVLTDRVLALDLLTGAIGATKGLTAASITADNPDLKRMLKEFTTDSMMGLEALETYIMDKEWMNKYAGPDEQLTSALKRADALIAMRN